MIKRVYRSLRFRLARFLPLNHQQVFFDIYKAPAWGSNGTAQLYSGYGEKFPFSRRVRELLRGEPEKHTHSSIINFQIFD